MLIKKVLPFCIALSIGALTSTANAQSLSPTEQKIVATVQARSEAALQLLERSVNINSGTLNHAGVREVGKLFSNELESLGFKTSWSEMPAAMNRAGHCWPSVRASKASAY